MSDLEFDVLDELYFVIHFNELAKATELDNNELKPLLIKLYNKGWLRCYGEPDEELDNTNIDLEVNYHKYYYLASKEGLKAHNKS